MRLSRAVVGRWAMAEVGMDDYPEALELLEIPVDGRERDVGRLVLDLGRELLGGSVHVSTKEAAHEKPARRGDPSTSKAELREHVVDLVLRAA